MIDLYTSPTPNGWKVSIGLEEMGFDYDVFPIDLKKGEQKTLKFRDMNPNSRIPVIVDKGADDFAVFESGAILMYLAEKSGKYLPTDVRKRSKVIQWLMFQMSGLGPMMGQSIVFHRYWPEKLPDMMDRYKVESERLLAVLDRHLSENEFLAGEYSIADMANWSWARSGKWANADIKNLTHLRRWLHQIKARPAVERGLQVPEPVTLRTKEDEKKLAKQNSEMVRTAKEKIG